jgi:hypothetical protein
MFDSKLRKSNIVLFWHHEDLVEFISSSISIIHIHGRDGDSDDIQFECTVEGHSFFMRPRGYIEARYAAAGDPTNPHNADLICTIGGLKRLSLGVLGLTVLPKPGAPPIKDEVRFILRVEGNVTWNIFEENDGD